MKVGKVVLVLNYRTMRTYGTEGIAPHILNVQLHDQAALPPETHHALDSQLGGLLWTQRR